MNCKSKQPEFRKMMWCVKCLLSSSRGLSYIGHTAFVAFTIQCVSGNKKDIKNNKGKIELPLVRICLQA